MDEHGQIQVDSYQYYGESQSEKDNERDSQADEESARNNDIHSNVSKKNQTKIKETNIEVLDDE